MFDSKGTILTGLWVAWFAVVVIGLIGWVMNIVKIFQIAQPIADWGAFEVARVIGVFLAPLGAALGFV